MLSVLLKPSGEQLPEHKLLKHIQILHNEPRETISLHHSSALATNFAYCTSVYKNGVTISPSNKNAYL